MSGWFSGRPAAGPRRWAASPGHIRHSNAEWRHLRDSDRAGWARAVEVDEALRRPGTVANRNMQQAIYLHRSCLSLADVDLGGGDVTGGVAHHECEAMCGL